MIINATNLAFDILNEEIQKTTEDCIITHCLGQRFIASGLGKKNIAIHGIPGNALGAYLNGAEITDAVVMPGAVIERGAVVCRAIVAENAHICAGAVVGEETGLIAVVGPKAVIASGESVAAGVQVDADAQ